MIAKAVHVVRESLPQFGPRILVLGGKSFGSPDIFALVRAVSGRFASDLAGGAVVLTGGMPGVQKAFAKGVGSDFAGLCHLLPEGRTSSGYGVGRDVQCGVSLEHRPAVAARLADVVLVFAGGASVAREATAAFARGALVIPMRCAGAASSAAFNLDDAALDRPAHVAMQSEWALLATQPCEAEAVAVAVVSIVTRAARRIAGSARSVRPGSDRSSLHDVCVCDVSLSLRSALRSEPFQKSIGVANIFKCSHCLSFALARGLVVPSDSLAVSGSCLCDTKHDHLSVKSVSSL